MEKIQLISILGSNIQELWWGWQDPIVDCVQAADEARGSPDVCGEHSCWWSFQTDLRSVASCLPQLQQKVENQRLPQLSPSGRFFFFGDLVFW